MNMHVLVLVSDWLFRRVVGRRQDTGARYKRRVQGARSDGGATHEPRQTADETRSPTASSQSYYHS